MYAVDYPLLLKRQQLRAGACLCQAADRQHFRGKIELSMTYKVLFIGNVNTFFENLLAVCFLM
jgi:hypothetical protein